ncbi:MAG TPA: phospholipase D family protein [Cytophagaceae bacterium]
MANFIFGNELNSEVEKIFEKAKNQLILISPYIKLHDRYSSALKAKLNNDELKIIVVFGKNEEDPSKSMSLEELDFFKQFPNIEIRYEKRLHAKYYANENSAILTSMNLYSFSQDNNIEAGVITKSNIFKELTSSLVTSVTGDDTLDVKAWNYFARVVEQSELLFKKVPTYEEGLLKLNMLKKYKESVVEKDILETFFKNKVASNKNSAGESYISPDRNESLNTTNKIYGYCIRTGKLIPFNPKKPMSDEAYENWAKFGNENYPEKYCHYSGEFSNGETCYARPILRKNFKKAMMN